MRIRYAVSMLVLSLIVGSCGPRKKLPSLDPQSESVLDDKKSTMVELSYEVKVSKDRVEFVNGSTQRTERKTVTDTNAICEAAWSIPSFSYKIDGNMLIITPEGDKINPMKLSRVKGKHKNSIEGTWLISEGARDGIWRVETLVIGKDRAIRKTSCRKQRT